MNNDNWCFIFLIESFETPESLLTVGFEVKLNGVGLKKVSENLYFLISTRS